jgi:hypothetical protein
MVEDPKSDAELKEIPASEILGKIQRGEPVEYDHVRIIGDLDVNKLDLHKKHRTEDLKKIEGNSFIHKDMLNDSTALATLILACVTVLGLGITIIGPENIWEFSHPGNVYPITHPSGVAFIRGMPEFDQDSDHLVLPIQWRNTKKHSEITRGIELILERTINNSTKEIHFPMAGEYPNISKKAFEEVYTLKQSFALPPDSITDTTLVFHIANGWDPTNNNIHDFRFYPGEIDKIFITFHEGSGAAIGPVYLDTMCLPGPIKNLVENRSGLFWDYYVLDAMRPPNTNYTLEEHLKNFPRRP